MGYDKDDYMDRNIKNKCWHNVAESMYTGNWCELSDTQKEENGNYYINKFFLYILVLFLQMITNHTYCTRRCLIILNLT